MFKLQGFSGVQGNRNIQYMVNIYDIGEIKDLGYKYIYVINRIWVIY